MFELGDLSNRVYQYDVKMVPRDTLSLSGSNSFSPADVGKYINFDDTRLVLTGEDGSFEVVNGPIITESKAAGNWSMVSIELEGTNLTVSGQSTGGYNISNASYDSVSFDLAAQIPDQPYPTSLEFNTDGTKLFFGSTGFGAVYALSLSTGFDLSTASYNEEFFSVNSQESGSARGLAFNTDGTKMFVAGLFSKSVHQYTLTTGFDLSTASYDSVSFDLSSENENPEGLEFNTDGTKMFVVGGFPDYSVYQYTLTTGFDLSTASYDSVTFDAGSRDGNPGDLKFNTDGTQMFLLHEGFPDIIYQYTLSTGFDISTAGYYSSTLVVSSEEDDPTGLAFSTDGSKMFVAGFGSRSVYQYTTGVAFDQYPASQYNVAISKPIATINWSDLNDISFTDTLDDGDITYALSTDSQQSWRVFDSAGNARTIARNNNNTWEINDFIQTFDGENFVPASSNDPIGALKEAFDTEFTTPPFDIASMSYDSVYEDVDDQAVRPNCFVISTDGTKMFVHDDDNDTIYQYTLTTPFDVSTLSFDNKSKLVFRTSDFEFNADGTKLYTAGFLRGDVYQYTLATGFDIPTASNATRTQFSVQSQVTNPRSFALSTDGTRMFVGSTDTIHQYTLSTAFDITTASYDSVSFDLSSETSYAPDLEFNTDGTKMFVVGYAYNRIYQYTLTTGFDLSTASYDSISFSVDSELNDAFSLHFSPDGTKVFVLGISMERVHQYTIPVGLSLSTNRMSSTTLSGILKADLPELGDTFELGVGIKFDALDGSGNYLPIGDKTKPTFSGAVLNHHTNDSFEQAVLGTDYIYNQPNSNQIVFTSLVDTEFNVKIT
jgi:sugar lactone lactonase YvrE